MVAKAALIKEIDSLPPRYYGEVIDFIGYIKTKEAKYTDLSKEEAIAMTSEIIEKYRPALEELAK